MWSLALKWTKCPSKETWILFFFGLGADKATQFEVKNLLLGHWSTFLVR